MKFDSEYQICVSTMSISANEGEDNVSLIGLEWLIKGSKNHGFDA